MGQPPSLHAWVGASSPWAEGGSVSGPTCTQTTHVAPQMRVTGLPQHSRFDAGYHTLAINVKRHKWGQNAFIDKSKAPGQGETLHTTLSYGMPRWGQTTLTMDDHHHALQ